MTLLDSLQNSVNAFQGYYSSKILVIAQNWPAHVNDSQEESVKKQIENKKKMISSYFQIQVHHKMRCFWEKITPPGRILHNRRLHRLRQISTQDRQEHPGPFELQ